MIINKRKSVFIILVGFLAVLLYLWYQQRTTFLYIVNNTDSTHCFYLDEQFKTAVPKGKTVRLKVKGGRNKILAVSHTIGGMFLEEFRGNMGGKYTVYSIMGKVKNTKGTVEDGRVIRINKGKPGN